MTLSLYQQARSAMAKHGAEAGDAYNVFVRYCGGVAPPRVPGMSTDVRLAIRIENGKTIEESAAREYVYRWSLALQSPVFGVPHPIGL